MWQGVDHEGLLVTIEAIGGFPDDDEFGAQIAGSIVQLLEEACRPLLQSSPPGKAGGVEVAGFNVDN